MISLLDGGIRSGNTTWNSTNRSPRWAEFLARGSPSPISLLTEPGLMTSLQGTGFVCPSRVGALIVHPHNAYRKRKDGEGYYYLLLYLSIVCMNKMASLLHCFPA